MKHEKIAEPDYDFRLETIRSKGLTNRIFLESEMLILKCTAGEAAISINSEEHQFKAGSNFLLADGLILKFLACSRDFEMSVLRFSPNFYNEIYPRLDRKAIEAMSYCAPDLYDQKAMIPSDLIFQQLCLLHKNKEHAYHNKLVINLIVNYIYEIYEQTYRLIDNRDPYISDHRNYLLDKFFALTADKYTTHRNIAYYAGKLNITSRYLYKICKENIQMTPKQCIDYVISGNAKRLLLTSNLTNQQISDELNFPDQSTFGQFFKRNVGMSPSEFRNRYK